MRGRKYCSFINCRRGVAAIEFAITLPFLLLLLFGTYQLTAYVQANSRAENIANDLAVLLAKESCVAVDVSPGDKVMTAVCTGYGGKTRIENIFDTVLPFLLYPQKYDPNNGVTQVEARFVGMPGIGTCSNGIGPQIVWKDRYPMYSATVTGAIDSGDIKALAAYSNQPYIAVTFVMNFSQIVNSGLTLTPRIEKTGRMPVRSQWVDGACGNPIDNDIQAGEFISTLQYCTDCNFISTPVN